jgi:hypothetical protein
MKKLYSLLLVITVALATAPFSAESHAAKNSDLTSEITVREAVYDFGTLLEGDKAVHTFIVENTGDTSFMIKKIKAPCGCTTADYTRGEIAPGAEGKVTLQVNTKGYGGRKITKAATVIASDPNVKGVKLRMTGNVAVFANIEPKSIKLVGSPEEPVRSIVRIVPSEAYPFHIVGEPETGKDTYQCTLEEKNGVYILTAENIAKKDAIFFDTVTLKTDHPEKPEIKIKVVGKIKTENRTGD